jgi:hypothetical protein
VDNKYAFTAEILSNMLSRKRYKEFFDKQLGKQTRLSMECDFVWWYWLLAGVGIFAVATSIIGAEQHYLHNQ